jgi:hypothetical protein
VSAWRQTAPDVPVVFDALGGGVDGEYLEARTLAELAG